MHHLHLLVLSTSRGRQPNRRSACQGHGRARQADHAMKKKKRSRSCGDAYQYPHPILLCTHFLSLCSTANYRMRRGGDWGPRVLVRVHDSRGGTCSSVYLPCSGLEHHYVRERPLLFDSCPRAHDHLCLFLSPPFFILWQYCILGYVRFLVIYSIVPSRRINSKFCGMELIE